MVHHFQHCYNEDVCIPNRISCDRRNLLFYNIFGRWTGRREKEEKLTKIPFNATITEQTRFEKSA